MSGAQATAMYLAAAGICLVVVVLLLRWARPEGGVMSPKLQRPGMETLVGGVASLAGTLSLGFAIGAALAAFSQ